MNIQLSSRTDMWFTPPYIIEMCRQVLGDITLGPASCYEANIVVKDVIVYLSGSINNTEEFVRVFSNIGKVKV